MIHPVVICLLFSMVSGLNSELVKNPLEPLFEIPSTFNDTSNNLQKLQYTNIGQPQAILNCSNYAVHHEYLILENGSLLLPGSDYPHEYGSYYVKNETAVLCDDKAGETSDDSYLNFTKEFLECTHLLIGKHEYKLLENGDIYVDIYSKSYSPGDYFREERGVFICLPNYAEMLKERNISSDDAFSQHVHKFPEIHSYVTNIGLSVSTICLLFHLVVFCSIAEVRNLHGCCLASLSFALLMAYLCFWIASSGVTASGCIYFGFTVYYFFTSSFFWMNAIAFDTWRSFRTVTRELRLSSHRLPWRRFFLYSVFSWMVPAVLTVLITVFDSTDILPEEIRPNFGSTYCWFGNKKALLIFFASPLILIMVLNAVFFFDVIYIISRATLRTSQTYEETLKKRFFMSIKLALIMGLTWLVGIIGGLIDYWLLWYAFIILNTLQGLFIFIVFSCSSKVRLLFFKKYRSSKAKRGSTSVRTITQISATV